jgi:gluconate 2-dehydrogenase gamma chain
MANNNSDRRGFLKGALVGTSAAITSSMTPNALAADSSTTSNNQTGAAHVQGYVFFNLAEQEFIEKIVNHMIPADALSPQGTDIGIHHYIDRALSGSWGKGDRLYQSGPWKKGLPTQGYQLPLTPADLYRVCIEQSNLYCVKKYGVKVSKLPSNQLEEFLLNLRGGKVTFADGPPSTIFFSMLYQNIMEGMFSDPIYGGNRNKAGWKLVGFPGAVATHALDVENYFDKKYTAPMFGISDLS